MPFGLSNAPNTFMRLITHVLQPFMRKFSVIYFNDILVYSKFVHVDHLRQLFHTLREAKLFANLKKCLSSTSGLFLGFIVSAQGNFADRDKVRAIREWHEPKTITEAQSFHGLASLFRRFIRHFSSTMAPSTNCLKKKPSQWTPQASSAFTKIKGRISSALILGHPDFSKTLEVACDAYGFGIRGVLS